MCILRTCTVQVRYIADYVEHIKVGGKDEEKRGGGGGGQAIEKNKESGSLTPSFFPKIKWKRAPIPFFLGWHRRLLCMMMTAVLPPMGEKKDFLAMKEDKSQVERGREREKEKRTDIFSYSG